jgi:hypothetical protein
MEERVSALIGPSTNWWNYSLIKEVFMEEEATTICSIAIYSGR